MKFMRRIISISFVIIVLLILATIHVRATASEKVTADQSGRFKILGPFTHRNLALYLVKGTDVIRRTKFVTLEQALKDEIPRKIREVAKELGILRNCRYSKYDWEHDDVRIFLDTYASITIVKVVGREVFHHSYRHSRDQRGFIVPGEWLEIVLSFHTAAAKIRKLKEQTAQAKQRAELMAMIE